MFKEKKQEVAPDTPGIRLLCPTHWTVCGEPIMPSCKLHLKRAKMNLLTQK